MSLDALLGWAAQHGASVEGLEFKEVAPHNNGGVAVSLSPRISLPTSLAIKLLDATRAMDMDPTATRNVNGVLKIFLARERSAGYVSTSKYRHYLQLLPALMQTGPLVWSPAEQELLKGSNLGSSLREITHSLVEEWWLVVTKLPELMPKPEMHFVNMKFYYEHKFYEAKDLHDMYKSADPDNWTSFPNYLWALMMLKSRSFPSYLLKAGPHDPVDVMQEDVAMLLPVIDLLNHKPAAKVTWEVRGDRFLFTGDEKAVVGEQVFNNYGAKGNEELLLAYGFCLPDNKADSVALKVKVPPEMVRDLEAKGVEFPKTTDYTTLVVQGESAGEPNGLYFVAEGHVPANLVLLFQWLVKNKWETELTLRMRLAGLNHLRSAFETKSQLISPNVDNAHVRLYLESQKRILTSAVKVVKRLEKALIDENKERLLTLKSVYKNDLPLLRALLVTMGAASYEDIVEKQMTDHVWLLYLIRCYNRAEYALADAYLPEWIFDLFCKVDRETEMEAQEVVNFQPIYESLVPPMQAAVPELVRGRWTVRELIVALRVLDGAGFVRGRAQECVLVASGIM